MPNYTSNYRLTKPLPNELYNIDIHNNNMENVDLNLKEVANVANEADNRSKTNENLIEALKTYQEEPFEEQGNPVTVHSFQDAPLRIESHFAPIQSGSGDPYLPGGGVQLYDVHNVLESSTASYTVDSDDWVTIELDNTSGSGDKYASFYTPASDKLITGKTYAIVSEIKEITLGTTLQIAGSTATSNKGQFGTTVAYTSTGVRVSAQTTRDDFTNCVTMLRTVLIAIPGYKTKAVFRISVLEDTSVSEDTFTYKPYSNIRPISARTGVEMVRCGKNLTPFAISGKSYGNGGVVGKFDTSGFVINGTPSTDYTKIINDEINLPVGKYYVSGGEQSKAYLQVSMSYTDGHTEHYNNTAFEITGKETRVQIMIQTGAKASVGTLSDYHIRPMLVCGDTAPTTFELYQGDTYSVEFLEPIYGGTVYWREGSISEKWELVRFIPTARTDYGTKGYAQYAMYVTDTAVTDDDYSVCDTFKRIYAYQRDEEYYYVTNHTVYVYSNRWDTLEEAVAWFTENEVKMCYLRDKYRVASFSEFTSKKVVALNGVNTIYSNCENNIVTGRNDILWLTHSLIERIENLEQQLPNLI